ncbi:hypothetical protein Tco_1117192 [Tanacetum coccineum]
MSWRRYVVSSFWMWRIDAVLDFLQMFDTSSLDRAPSEIAPVRELNEKFWISSDSDPVNWLLDASKDFNKVADVDKVFRKSERFPSTVLQEIIRSSNFLPNNGHNQLYMDELRLFF